MALSKDMPLCLKTLIGETGTSYQKKEVLGRGTFGIVFRGSHQDKEVAVKRIELHRMDPEDREVNLQKKLEHDNVLKILASYKDDVFGYIVLELCAGTLSEVIENSYKGPALPSDQMVLYQIADGLNFIHSKKLIHRDIKPENILISLTGHMKLSDFGLSKQISNQDTCSMSGTRGTRLWMAPEFYDNIKKATPKCDVFPCGCVFFVFLAREYGVVHPFGDTKDSLQIQLNIREGKPVNIEKLDSKHYAVSFVRKMIERDPSKRVGLMVVKNELRNHIKEHKKITNNFARSSPKKVPLKVLEKTFEILNNFNNEKVISQTIGLKKPEISTFVQGSRDGEKALLEPMISNFEKSNSNTGLNPEESFPWTDVMQALSHYSYHSTNRHLLLCDLQGEVIKNGAVITDPVIMSTTREYGSTDLGNEGISTFFANHTCNKFCDSKWMIPRAKRDVSRSETFLRFFCLQN